MFAPLPEKLTRAGFSKLPTKGLRDHFRWADDLAAAREALRRSGVEIILTDADYQVAKIIGDGVRLVIYPHKTSAGHRHLRVRNENSNDPTKASAVMVALDKAKTGWCTFGRLNGRLPSEKSA